MPKKPKNTLTHGSIRSLVYYSPEERLWYGAVLECNLSVSSEKSRADAMAILHEQTAEYIRTAWEIDAPEVLNQTVDEELETLWNHLIHRKKQPAETPLVPLFAATSLLWFYTPEEYRTPEPGGA